MTLQVDPGCGDAAYTSTLFEVSVNDNVTHCYEKSRTAEYLVPGFWGVGETVKVNCARFGTDATVVVRISRINGDPVTSFRVFPRRFFDDRSELQGEEIVISMPPHTKCCVVVNGVRKERLYLCADELAEAEPVGGVVYDGTQVSVPAGTALIFPAGVTDLVNDGTWQDKLFPVDDGATVYFRRGSWVIGSFDLRRAANTDVAEEVTFCGPGGNLSGEWITHEAVVALPTFDEQREHSMIFGYVAGLAGFENEVRGINIWQNPLYAFGTAEVNYVRDIAILGPWTANSDGLKAFGAPGTDGFVIEDNISWNGDDCITFPEWCGDGVVRNNLLSTAGSAVLMFGYNQEFRTTYTHEIVNNTIIACNDYYYQPTGDDATEGGEIIKIWTDNTFDSPTPLYRANILIDGLYIDGDQLNAVLFSIGNRPYPPFPDAAFFPARGAFGAASGITIRNVVAEATPVEPSKFIALDAQNTPSSIALENIVTAGVRWSVRNSSKFIDQSRASDHPFNVTIDGASLVA